MRIDILTIFPRMFDAVLGESIVKRAQERKLIEIRVHNIRDYSQDKHRKVDDRPYGGGPGMVMCAQPIFNAVKKVKSSAYALQSGASADVRRSPDLTSGRRRTKTVLLSPQGKVLSHKLAKKLAKTKHLILICGHYEGIDERVADYIADEEISIGDYILTGGELAAMVLIDSIVRFVPGVLGHKDSANEESFSSGLLEYPQYTRPANFRGMKVPKVLLSGDHKKISTWRKKQTLKRTKNRRPDILGG